MREWVANHAPVQDKSFECTYLPLHFFLHSRGCPRFNGPPEAVVRTRGDVASEVGEGVQGVLEATRLMTSASG